MTSEPSGRSRVIDVGAAYTPTEVIRPARIVIRDGRIESVAQGKPAREEGADYHDAGDLVAAPGFIDPHVHGGGGADVMDATWDALDRISRNLARHGTTAFCPTTVSAPAATLDSTVGKLGELMRSSFGGARPLGLHLEGPFISALQRGTHPADCLCRPDAAVFERWLVLSGGMLRLLTLAPELEGASSLIGLARKHGVVVGMGHSDASLEVALDAVDQGVSYAVHTFNAMRGLHHREPGMAGAVLADDRIWAEIIADGVHVAPEVVKVFARAKGKDRVLLATDATSATGMPDGTYMLGTRPVTVSGGVCRDAEGRLAGSTLRQDLALRNYGAWSGADFATALLASTTNVASALGLDDAGVIRTGARADIVLLDSGRRVVRTYVGGQCVFDRLREDPLREGPNCVSRPERRETG